MTKDDAELEEFKAALGLYIDDPWERVKFIFSKNDYGERHPDFRNALEAAEMGFFVGGILGGAVQQSEYLKQIKEKSDAKIYHNKVDAYRQLSQESLLGFVKGCFKWGPRVGGFVGGFTLFASCVEAYRNKTGVVEYSISGSMIGSALRFNFGVRGMLVGGLVGSVLGTFYGLAHLAMCKFTQTDGIQIKYGQFALSKYIEKRLAEKPTDKKKAKENSEARSPEMLNPLDALSFNDEEENETEKKGKVK